MFYLYLSLKFVLLMRELIKKSGLKYNIALRWKLISSHHLATPASLENVTKLQGRLLFSLLKDVT